MDIAPNVPPHAFALQSLMRSHLRHLDKDDADGLATPQWTAAVESARTVAAIKPPGRELGAGDIPMIVGTGSPHVKRHLYCSMPCSQELATKADESEVAIFTYNRRGRIQPVNRTAADRQAKAWYPPAKAIAPMRLFDDEHWEPVVQATGDSGRPSLFEAAAGWVVLLLLIAFLGASGYMALRFFGLL
ncbi:hypothetical protein GCM10027447_30780 [Glycomyces halotolerans]